MISRHVAVGLLATGCLTAAAGGSYLAVRQNAPSTAVQPVTTLVPAAPSDAVTETEAVVMPDPPRPVPEPEPAAIERPEPAPARPSATPTPRRSRPAAAHRAATTTTHSPAAPADAPEEPAVEPVTPVNPQASEPTHVEAAPADPAPVRAPEPTFDEIVIPASSVIGLEVERTITSEQAEVEDRVEARVTRDVYADGRLAIPAGSRVTGTVSLVERGGKLKDRARLGVRFHTLVLADGRQIPIRTDTVFREGDSPGAESSRKIGGAAIGGAVLGAILGGGKGAMAGAAAGAAGGTAAVMAGGRNAATLTGGSVVNVRLSAPVSVEIER